jgi:hypothetical protein
LNQFSDISQSQATPAAELQDVILHNKIRDRRILEHRSSSAGSPSARLTEFQESMGRV